MSKQLRLMVVAGAMTALAASPAAADRLILWDQHIATAMSDSLISESVCRGGPHAAPSPHCAGGKPLDTRHHRALTALDEMVLFVHRSKKLDMKREFGDRTRLKFDAELDDVLQPEATLRLELKIRFNTTGP